MSGFRPETHVAQQSRRDKLRVPQNPLPDPHHHPAQFRSCGSLYDPPQPPSMFTPGMLDLAAAAEASLLNPSTSGFHDAAGGIGWKGDWSLSCMGGGGGAPIQTPLIPSHLYHLKHGLSGYQDISGDLPSHDGEKQYGDLHFSSSQFYHNSLQDVVTSPSSTVGAGPTCPWVDGGSELLLLPSYGNPGNSPVWMNRGTQQWYGEGDLARIKGEGDSFGAVASGGGSTQGLSLSLSSNPLPELPAGPFEERFRREDLAGDVGFSCPYPKYPVSSVQGTVGSAEEPRGGAGPLGPFTGYAAILKSSKFLKPAQQLLDEFCSVVTGSKLSKHCDKSDVTVGDCGADGRGGNSVVSSSSAYYGSSKAGGDSRGCQIHRPEVQQKKVKLLYMQEEVCKRYKQYHQQMQMVVSSFETVAGLSSATPYASLALKAVSKHFRCLKNAISDQLRHVSKLLGDELMSSPGSSKGETTTTATPRLKYIDQSIRKNKAAENSLSFFDHSQPVWRPQRGLPERAVAVLRAWLFDHFLHPYPTDTDKHMLATQTGLSRNQVSNWFINARVRLWKPMVEEIHMLETKGASGMDLNSSSRNHGNPVIDDLGQHSSDQLSEAQSNRPMDCSPMGPILDEESSRAMEQWHREKRSRMEACGIPEGMDGSLMSFAAYQGGMDIGGLGAVSLTLGLRHNEGEQQQQMRRHFGSHMVHDFVG